MKTSKKSSTEYTPTGTFNIEGIEYLTPELKYLWGVIPVLCAVQASCNTCYAVSINSVFTSGTTDLSKIWKKFNGFTPKFSNTFDATKCSVVLNHSEISLLKGIISDVCNSQFNV